MCDRLPRKRPDTVGEFAGLAEVAPMWENLLASWRQSGQKQDPCPSLLDHNAKYKRLLPPYCDFANGVRVVFEPVDFVGGLLEHAREGFVGQVDERPERVPHELIGRGLMDVRQPLAKRRLGLRHELVQRLERTFVLVLWREDDMAENAGEELL